MTPTDLIRNAMIIISKEMGITPEKAYYFMEHYKEYVDYKEGLNFHTASEMKKLKGW